MSANVYTIEAMLENMVYRSKSVTGFIIHAEKDNRAVWYGEDLEPYLVEIRPENGTKNVWRTLAVKVS
jgi:hypothetical protein